MSKGRVCLFVAIIMAGSFTLLQRVIAYHPPVPAVVTTSRLIPLVTDQSDLNIPGEQPLTMETFRTTGAGNFIGFRATRADGPAAIAVHNLLSAETRVLIKEGNSYPDLGPLAFFLTGANMPIVNANGSVAFLGVFQNGMVFTSAIVVVDWAGEVTKVVAEGDSVPGGGTIASPFFTDGPPRQINASGQVIFRANIVPGNIPAIFRWTQGVGIAKIAAVGDATSNGGTITSFVGSAHINSAGNVAFVANISGVVGSGIGIFVGSPGNTPAKVVAEGDSAPEGSFFSSFTTPGGFNDSGEVAFICTLTGGVAGGGVFVGTTTAPPVEVALGGANSPAGGQYLINNPRTSVEINNQHDVAFHSFLNFSGTAGSAHFVRRGAAGVVQAVVVQGQPAPGTMGTFDVLQAGIFPGQQIQLGPDGDISVQNTYTENGMQHQGIWHVRTDNTVVAILTTEIPADVGGGTVDELHGAMSWNSGGVISLYARLSSGTFFEGIFAWAPTCNPVPIAPASRNFAAAGGLGSVTLNNTTTCAWTAVSSAPWITITTLKYGIGAGSISYFVDQNPGAVRSGTITIGGAIHTVRQGLAFADVDPNSAFGTHIGKISAVGVTLGCGQDGMGQPLFCPGAPVTREQMAAFIVRALGELSPPTPASQRFVDVPPSNIFYNFIDRMAVLQITLGCGNGTTYCPAESVTREQMAAFMIRALGEFSPPTPASQRFVDVPPSNIFYNFIDRMAVLQITLGCGDGTTYCPSSNVTREQMAAFLVRAFQL